MTFDLVRTFLPRAHTSCTCLYKIHTVLHVGVCTHVQSKPCARKVHSRGVVNDWRPRHVKHGQRYWSLRLVPRWHGLVTSLLLSFHFIPCWPSCYCEMMTAVSWSWILHVLSQACFVSLLSMRWLRSAFITSLWNNETASIGTVLELINLCKCTWLFVNRIF